MSDPSDWGALGYFGGEIAGLGVPVFTNLRRPNIEEAKQLCGGMSASGAVSMFQIAGVTLEAPDLSAAFRNKVPREKTMFDEGAKTRTGEKLNRDSEGKVDLVFIGCPLCTFDEVIQMAHLLEGKRVAEGTRLWVSTDYPTRFMAEKYGYSKMIEASGAELLAGGCPQGFNTAACRVGRIATNSAKQAYYVPGELGSKVVFGNLARCIEIAIKGRA
jgi:hypothetical protein